MSKKNISKTSKVKIKPLGDRVLLQEIDEKEKKTASGLILPDNISDKDSKKGKVIAVGQGKILNDGTLIKSEVKEGDTVLYSWGDTVKIDGEEFTLVSSDNITAIIQ